jgi:hypothetical protein
MMRSLQASMFSVKMRTKIDEDMTEAYLTGLGSRVHD